MTRGASKGVIMRFLGIYSVLVLASSSLAQANQNSFLNDANYFEIASVNSEVISVEDRDLSVQNESALVTPTPPPYYNPNGGYYPSYQGGNDALAIANLFFQAWDLVKDGAPIVNAQYKNAYALPNISNNNWTTLTGWKRERTIECRIFTKNVYGMTTVDLQYQVKLIYGGNVKGIGQYIASARVVPVKIDVLWGYNVDMAAEVPTILNISKPENPIASITMDVKYTISTILRSYTQGKTYTLQGNGLMKSGENTLVPADL